MLKSILCMMLVCLLGCTTQQPSSNAQSLQETTTPSLETNTSFIADTNLLGEMSYDDLDAYVYDGGRHYLFDIYGKEVSVDDFLSLGAKQSQSMNGMQITEVIGMPQKITADFSQEEGIYYIAFNAEKEKVVYQSREAVDDDMKEAINEIGTYVDFAELHGTINYEVDASSEKDEILSIYFLPICYKIEKGDKTRYVPKAIDGKYMDGIYDVMLSDSVALSSE